MAQDWEKSCTREEAEANERAKNMRCRGPHKASLSARDWQRLAPAVQDALATIPHGSRAPHELVTVLIEQGSLSEARLLDEAIRQGCGADFADIVNAHPFDGCEREYTCPKCGLAGAFTSPIYHIIDAE